MDSSTFHLPFDLEINFSNPSPAVLQIRPWFHSGNFDLYPVDKYKGDTNIYSFEDFRTNINRCVCYNKCVITLYFLCELRTIDVNHISSILSLFVSTKLTSQDIFQRYWQDWFFLYKIR